MSYHWENLLETDYAFLNRIQNISRTFPDFLSKQILLMQKTESVLTKSVNNLYSIKSSLFPIYVFPVCNAR